MNVYVVKTDVLGLTPKWEYFATLKEAHSEAKDRDDREDTRVELLDIPTDKESLITLLNDSDAPLAKLLRTWRLTSRGGLVECANGD